MVANNTSERWMRRVVDVYRRDLQRCALRLVGDEISARRIVNETFERLWQSGQIDDPQRLRRWLFMVCRNQCTQANRDRPFGRALRNEQPHVAVSEEIQESV